MGIGLSGAEEIPDQLPWGADVIAPTPCSDGHQTFRWWRLCCYDLDMPLCESLMPNIGGIETSGGREISDWIQTPVNISTVLRNLTFGSWGRRMIRWPTGTSSGTENSVCSLHLSNSSQRSFGHSKYILSLLFFPATWVSRRWIRHLDDELDILTVVWTSQRWLGCLGYSLVLHSWDLKYPTNTISQTC